MYRYYLIIIALCWFPVTFSFASTCSHSESLQTHLRIGDFQEALQELDNCLAASQQNSTQDELSLLNHFIQQVLISKPSLSFQDVYGNFQRVLSIHLLSPLSIHFEQYFKKNPKTDKDLFAEIRKSSEKYYFYYDTGRFLSHSRGIALTEQSLIWKNITDKPQLLAFNDIKHIALLYKRGLSLTGWKLRFNQDPNKEIRLSGVPNEGVLPFVSAIIYFINFHTAHPIALEVPDRELAIAAGWITLCRDKQVEQDDPITALQLLDACFSVYGNDFQLSKVDRMFLNTLIKRIFDNTQVSFATGYHAFKIVLSTHFFKKLSFKFGQISPKNKKNDDFLPWWYQTTQSSNYFYFDMGRIQSNARGLVLTNTAILWRNLFAEAMSWNTVTDSEHTILFKDIEQVSLIQDTNFAYLERWLLRFNDKYDIVLSQMSEEDVTLFATAVVYFINMASGAHLSLQTSDDIE